MQVRTLRSSPLSAVELALATLRFHFQPIVSARSGRVTGMEALARPVMRVSGGGPREFVAMVRRQGHARAFRAALFRAARVALDRISAPTRLFLNVTRDDLEDGLLLALTPQSRRIVLELDEEECPYAACSILDEYRQRGFGIALDDFGVGKTALAGLAAVGPDAIKLDRSLIHGIESEPLRREAIAALLRLGKRSGVEVICEGIERATERDLLVELGADLMQGYLFGVARPLARRASAGR